MEYFTTRVLSLLCISTLCCCSPQCNWQGRYLNNRCQCYEGFKGTHCENDCHCEGHGFCKADGTCECETGWKWSASQHKCVWDCSCHGGAQCIGPGECGCSHTCKWGACRNGQCVCYEGYKGDDCSHYDRNIMLNKDVQVGLNLGGLAYYQSEIKWVDVSKQSSQWHTQRHEWDWDTKELDKIPLRKDGYPSSFPAGLNVAKTIFQGWGELAPTGNYTLLYDGEGSIGFRLSTVHVHYQSKGRIVVEIPKFQHDGIQIRITETNPHNPLHNLRFVSPGYEHIYQRFPYHPFFLEFLKRFTEARYMDFLHTNGHKPEPTTWNTRRTPDYHTQDGEYGGAIEHLVEISNWAGLDAWVCVPHAADDDFVRQFAAYVKRNLRPDLKVYVEYSNEVWGTGFRQSHYAKEKGKPLWPGDDDMTINMKYLVKRASEVADIWSSIWSGNDRQRLTNVVGWDTGKQTEYDHFMQILGSKKTKFQALTVTEYFLCGAPFFNHPSDFAKMSMSQIKQSCDNDLANQKRIDQHYMDLAKAHGMKLVMYEGGPLMFAPSNADGPVTDKCMAFNRDPHIRPAILDIMNAWYSTVTTNSANSRPGGIFNYFSSLGLFNKWGSWGIAEYTGQDLYTAPKWLAVQTFISDHWPNTLLGPKCSFTQDQATNTAFGCFPSGGHYVCAKSADNGHSWTNLPSLHQSSSDHVTLDGYDVKEKKLYVRVMDRTYVSKYHVYSENTRSWTTMKSIPYFADEFAPSVIPRMPADADHGLSSQTHC
ncbi:hypothetical protein V1264_022725 [Littorina saxatilis]|uniref:EGF-like domain-containing protein n=1 Tax=Littorina saxatilis TaxID=31220 RepID=A0AAN9B6D1_9CAEN